MPRFDDRFARQNRCEPPPEFPLASPYPGIVHHLSGPNGRARTQIHPKTSGSVDGAPLAGFPPPFTFIPRRGFDAQTLAGTLDSLVRVSRRAADPHYASTLAQKARSSVQAGGMTARAIRLPGGSYIPGRFLPPPEPVLAWTRATIPGGHRASGGRPRGRSGGQRFPLSNFTCCLTPFSRCFSSFDHSTCALSVSGLYLALDGIYHPLGAAFPNNSTRRRGFARGRCAGHGRGSHPPRRPVPRHLDRRRTPKHPL